MRNLDLRVFLLLLLRGVFNLRDLATAISNPVADTPVFQVWNQRFRLRINFDGCLIALGRQRTFLVSPGLVARGQRGIDIGN